ncbi:SRPBCC family protein [Acidiferrimicrobium sp. IK]|uniref:SRPBCC family protein n=1 Tax=Acidiferrimicrobium sp. IK TaxID=2871700 RepID=UPI0021CB26CA|nr:SRPBCC family protein [Acidiferrimicrobium sp. IK]MCU4183434.1 SRPBCC family protein [Acidiferrimicrobium sp. IK]
MGDVDVELTIHASTEAVWGLLEDPTRMGDLSPECVSGRWLDGATEAVPGARFRGSNRRGWRRWSTTCTVTEADPGRAIAWDVAVAGLPIATWGYRLRADGDTTAVTESFTDRRGPMVKVLGGWLRGVKDVPSHNQVMMQRTLEALRVAAETAASPSA